jgi:hypothetical protein
VAVVVVVDTRVVLQQFGAGARVHLFLLKLTNMAQVVMAGHQPQQPEALDFLVQL